MGLSVGVACLLIDLPSTVGLSVDVDVASTVGLLITT
jgi:hypothetical protein